MSEPEIIYLGGKPHRVVEVKPIRTWDSKNRPLAFTVMVVKPMRKEGAVG